MRINHNDKDFKVSVRLNEEQYLYLCKLSASYHCTVSDLIRSLINLHRLKEN